MCSLKVILYFMGGGSHKFYPTFHFYRPIRVKFCVKALQMMLLDIFQFHENRRTEGSAFRVDVD
jgi:hypothetical protein